MAMASGIYTGERYDLGALLTWAEGHILLHRPNVELVIDGKLYLDRWYLLPPNNHGNVYLHRWRSSDRGPEPHDHRYANRSLILRGYYLEHVWEGTSYAGAATRYAGEVVERAAGDFHRVEIVDDAPVLSLFFCGAVEQNWGFLTDRGKVFWEPFLGVNPSGRPA